MLKRAALRLAALLVPAALSAQPQLHPDELKLKPKIDAAIQHGVEALIEMQLRDGTWGRWGHYDGGKTALCVYALLKCGVANDHPAVRRAMLYLDGVRPNETYTTACMMLAYAASGTEEHLGRLKSLCRLLISWQRGGDFGYPHPHNGGDGWTRPDLSNTQYAALGLWIAQKHKVAVPGRVWYRLIEATLGYQTKVEAVDTLPEGTHTTAGGKLSVAGFSYTPHGKPTGSMTTAGVSILQICKIGLGGRPKNGRAVDRAIEQGLGWLGHHFTVDKNPFHKNWTYYYLYGLERVGSLTRVEKMGGHWWYVEGARQLLSWQNKDGTWRDRDHPEARTAFALLFLRRATGGAAATGGASGSGEKPHLFAAGGDKDDVKIAGAGQQPLNLYVAGFGEGVLKRHAARGLRITQVEYVAGKGGGERILGQVAGEPQKAWRSDAYLYRAEALARGAHDIRARVTLVAADAAPDSDATEVIESPPMKVRIRDVFARWMEAASRMGHANLLRDVKKTVTGSSAGKTAKNAVDGQEATHWVCGPRDKAPTLTVDLDKFVRARHLLVTQAGARLRDAGEFDRIKVIEVTINRDKEGQRVELDADPLAVTRIPLGASGRKVSRVTVRILERVPGRKRGQAGFAELVLTKD